MVESQEVPSTVQVKRLEWTITPWKLDGEGKWVEQPVILVQGRRPFFSDNPQDYISELERMHADPSIQAGMFWTNIGQLRDGLELIASNDNGAFLEIIPEGVDADSHS